MNVRELVNRLGARVVERRGGISETRWVLSEFESRNKTIVVYRDTIELLAELVAIRNLPFDVERLDDIAIAHECFHLMFPGKRGEDRVHAFVQELLDLPESPAVLNDALAAHIGEPPA